MQESQNLVVFQPCKSFHSRFLDILINTIKTTAELTLLFIIIDIILGYFYIESEIFAIEGISDILDTVIVVFVLNLIFYKVTTTTVDVQKKILKLRTFSLLSLVTQKDIMGIERIVVATHVSYGYNVVVVYKGKKIGTSIEDHTKFVTLLQELNPNIEVEYKE